MSMNYVFYQLRRNICSRYPARLFNQHVGLSYGKFVDPRSYKKRHFTTGVQTLQFTTGVQTLQREPLETAGWHRTDPGSRIDGIQPPKLHRTPERDQSVTVLVFDVETTGFLHKDHRITEIALRDLSGGKNSTFQTLINPERVVPKRVVALNQIGTDLVCRPDIPRFSDVLPLLLAYVRSRQAPGKPVLWVAHKAKTFDGPFLAQEFHRCSAQIPADWLFVDSLDLARKLKLVKSDGKKHSIKLEALREHYGIVVEGRPHRAMPDVMALCLVFQKITFDLKLTCEGLMNEAIGASEFSKVYGL